MVTISFFIINGVEVEPPQQLTVDLHTIDASSSGRNAAGRMVRDVIAQKVRLACSWPPLSDAEISLILRNVQGAFFPVTYPDPELGTLATKTFYVGDRTAPIYSYHPKFRDMRWVGLSFNMIEQ